MDLETIGPWVLFATGILLLWGAIGSHLFSQRDRSIWPLLIFGLAAAGTGIYGPLFLRDYGSFVEKLSSLHQAAQANPTDPEQAAKALEAYSEFFNEVAAGDVSEEVASAGLALTLAYPLPGMEEKLSYAVSAAENTTGRDLLVQTEVELEGKRRVADELRQEAEIGPAEIPEETAHYDAGTKRFLIQDPTTNRIRAGDWQRRDPQVLENISRIRTSERP